MSENNVQNIISLINSQMDSMNSYSLTISRMMGNINNSVRELIRLQEYAEMNHSLSRYYNNQGNYTRSSARLNRNFSPIASGSSGNMNTYPTPPATRRSVRDLNQRPTNVNRTTMPSLFSNNRLRRTHTNSLFNRRPLVQPTRRMSLQEFINTTLNQGNVTIPADSNQIMQETSIVDFEDLLDTDTTICPISLVTFDSSSNILRINRCGHVFEGSFLTRWFRQDSRCPVCRYNINNDVDATNNIDATNNTDATNNIDATNNADATNNTDDTNNIDTVIDNSGTAVETSPQNAIIYDISFSIPQLFGRDMSENQVNDVINSITDAITNAMSNNMSNSGSINLGNNIHALVESVSFQNNNPINNTINSQRSWGDMTEDSNSDDSDSEL